MKIFASIQVYSTEDNMTSVNYQSFSSSSIKKKTGHLTWFLRVPVDRKKYVFLYF